MTFIYSTDNHWLIILYTRSRSLRSALAAKDILLEILLGKLKSCRYSVHHCSYQFAVRLTEDAYSEFSAECIHIYYRLFWMRYKTLYINNLHVYPAVLGMQDKHVYSCLSTPYSAREEGVELRERLCDAVFVVYLDRAVGSEGGYLQGHDHTVVVVGGVAAAAEQARGFARLAC